MLPHERAIKNALSPQMPSERALLGNKVIRQNLPYIDSEVDFDEQKEKESSVNSMFVLLQNHSEAMLHLEDDSDSASNV